MECVFIYFGGIVNNWESWSEDSDYFEREDRIIVVSMILADRPKTIGEFACGTGIICKMLRDRGYIHLYCGTDITKSALEASKKHNPKEMFFYADLNEKLPLRNNELDISCIFTGLGYCTDIEATMKELKRVTKKYIYISQYNLFAPETNLRFLRGEGMGNQYNKEWFDAMLERVGLENVFECEVTNGKDYIARDNIPTSKTNHLYKLKC